MAKFTMLEMVQDILNDMDSDEVNSINDTPESAQVAQIISSTYHSMVSNRNWEYFKRVGTLTPSGDSSLPVKMSFPTDVKEIISIHYDKIQSGATKKSFEPVSFISTDDFLRLCNGRDSTASTTLSMDYSGVTLLIDNSRAPKYYTTFNDQELIFDAYDSSVDTTLQANKTQYVAYYMPTLTIDDDTIPSLPDEAFIALLEEAKSRCMFKLKQFNDVKAENESVRQKRWLATKNWQVDGGIKYPNYGRRGLK